MYLFGAAQREPTMTRTLRMIPFLARRLLFRGMEPITVASWIVAVSCGPGLPEGGTGTETGAAAGTSTSTIPTSGDVTAPTTSDGDTTAAPTGSESGSESGETTCCAQLDASNSSVEGTTVHGAVTLPWAWYGSSSGLCSGRLQVFLYADPPPPELGNSNVGIYVLVLLYEDMWPDGFQGTGPAFVEIVMGLETASTNGELTISRLDELPEPGLCEPGVPLASEARFEFTLSVQGVDWDLEGEVSAVYCPECDVFCP